MIICHIGLWHDLHHNMCEGSWNIPYFCWFLHPPLWSNIGVGFNSFYKFSFLSTLWVHVESARYIPWQVWYKGKQVMLVHSCSHWGALWDIEDYSEFGKWWARVPQPRDLVILNVHPWIVYFQRRYPPEMEIYGILLHLLSLFPNILE